MNRSNFLKSLATLIAAPSVLVNIGEPKIILYRPDVVNQLWFKEAKQEYMDKWMAEQERQMWYGKPIEQLPEGIYKHTFKIENFGNI